MLKLKNVYSNCKAFLRLSNPSLRLETPKADDIPDVCPLATLATHRARYASEHGQKSQLSAAKKYMSRVCILRKRVCFEIDGLLFHGRCICPSYALFKKSAVHARIKCPSGHL